MCSPTASLRRRLGFSAEADHELAEHLAPERMPIPSLFGEVRIAGIEQFGGDLVVPLAEEVFQSEFGPEHIASVQNVSHHDLLCPSSASFAAATRL